MYRIGVGGGAASSVQVQGDNKVDLDFGAVQRGDAEMEQKLNRVIRACAEQGADNPICSIHDQGAGGNGKAFTCIYLLIKGRQCIVGGFVASVILFHPILIKHFRKESHDSGDCSVSHFLTYWDIHDNRHLLVYQ